MLLHCLQLMLYLLHVTLTPNLVALGSWGPALLCSVSAAHARHSTAFEARRPDLQQTDHTPQASNIAPVTSLYALCLDQDLLVLCWSPLKLQHTS